MTAMILRCDGNRFPVAGFEPGGGCQDARLAGFHGGQAPQDVGEVFAHVDFEAAAVFYDGIKDGTFAPGLTVSCEQPVFLAELGRSDGVGILVTPPHLVSISTRAPVRWPSRYCH